MVDYKILFDEMQTISVLLVEDFEPLRVEMEEVLEDLCQKVIVALNGKEALSLYDKALQDNEPFDLIISDIQMPIMDGVQLSKHIRERNHLQPIVILSAYSDSEYLVELINIGVSKFLPKPIDHDALVTILYQESKKINKYKEQNLIDTTIHDLGEGYTWNTFTLVLKHNDTVVDLTKYELLLLECFLRKTKYVCSNINIMEEFYSKNIEVSENNIRNLVFKLRKKLPEKCIVSVYGLGYKFTCLG